MHRVRRVLGIVLGTLSLVAILASAACASDGVDVPAGKTTLSASNTSVIHDSAAKDVIQGYFSRYYKSVEQLEVDQAIWDYVVDTDETHLYLRQLQYQIYWRGASGARSRIADARVDGVDVEYANPKGDGRVDVKAYVKVSYLYEGDESGRRGGPGDTWHVTCATENGKLKIVALNSTANDYKTAKDLTAANLKKNAGNASYTKKSAIDDAYTVVYSRFAELLATTATLSSTTEKASQ